jgi:Condensation domain
VVGGTGSLTQLSPLPRDGPLPASFAQERIWRSASTAESAGFAMCSVTSLRGPIDLDALRAALGHGVARHEPLRTTFIEREGTPLQVVHPPTDLPLPVTDVTQEPDPESRAIELLREEASIPLDLERGPLLRLRLVRVGEAEHHLLRVAHHLLTDRHSWHIFITDAIAAYESAGSGRPLPPAEPLQYADFAAWERQSMTPDSGRCRDRVGWWRGAFDRAPPTLQLPFVRATPATDLPASDGTLQWGLDPAISKALDQLRHSEGSTRYTVRLAIFAALLALESGQDEVTIGTYIDNRRLPETESMFGDFSNLMTLILPFDPGTSLRRWLPKVRFLVREARARADIPYELLCDQLRAAQCTPPQINALFALIPPLPELPCGDVELVPARPAHLTMPWGFTFTLDQRRESDRCHVSFNAHLYDPDGVRRFVNRYIALAEASAAHPEQPLSDVHATLT